MRSKTPQYRLHKPSGRAVVTVGGADHYLGTYGSENSWRKYDGLVGPLVMAECARQLPAGHSALSVSDMLAAFWSQHVGKYQLELGRPTRRCPGEAKFRMAFELLRKNHGGILAKDFGPNAYREIQESLKVRRKNSRGQTHLTWSRYYINNLMEKMRAIFKWAASYELVPVSVPQSLATVPAIRRGDGARESNRRKPPSVEVFEAIVASTTPTLAAMLRLLRLTGMRPSELCQLRPCDIDMRDDIWVYRPDEHKTRRYGRVRTIVFGPESQAIIKRYLTPNLSAYLFTPTQSASERRHMMCPNPVASPEARRANFERYFQRRAAMGKSPRKPPERFYAGNFGNLVRFEGDRVFPVPADILHDPVAVSEWRLAHRVTPYQCRHAFATDVRARFGIEAARLMLDHSRLGTTEGYAQINIKSMKAVASKIG
jgi:integrase